MTATTSRLYGRTRLPRVAMHVVLAGAVLIVCCMPAAGQNAVARGQALAFDRSKGNCLACHVMKGGDVASSVGPALSDMRARFPDADALRAIIADEETRNPQTVMPAFGKNLILTNQEIGDIVAFLDTL